MELLPPLFGNDSAEADDLLLKCYIQPPGTIQGKPLIVGKWGTGKTGYILYNFRHLTQFMGAADTKLDRAWYFDEKAIDIALISDLYDHAQGNIHSFKRMVEEIWDAEIIRRHIIILSNLYTTYGSPSGEHWQTIIRYNAGFTMRDSLLRVGTSIMDVISKSSNAAAITTFLGNIRKLIDPSLRSKINKCISEIPKNFPRPVVAVEPIETPNSALEGKPEFADILISCLLNIYQQKYQISENQNLRLVLSIPWHRFDRSNVGQPQKLSDGYGEFTWNKRAMRDYINKRIEYEFEKYGNKKPFLRPGEDLWDKVFPKGVINKSCGGVIENSFSYVARHTQYRIRDILRFVREIVEFEINKSNLNRYDFFENLYKNLPVPEQTVRLVVRSVSIKTASERFIEAERRFPKMHDVKTLLYGMGTPFSREDLKKRLATIISDRETIFLYRDWLWQSGIIGIQLIAKSEEAKLKLIDRLGNESTGDYIGKSNLPEKFYAFSHTTSEIGLSNLVSAYDNDEMSSPDIELNYVFHPMMFEALDTRISETTPIGC